MRYDAISIDTSILRLYSFDFSTGPLSLLARLQDRASVLVQSDVAEEAIELLEHEVRTSLSEAQRAQMHVRRLGVNWPKPKYLDDAANVQDIARKRFNEFLTKINAQTIPSSPHRARNEMYRSSSDYTSTDRLSSLERWAEKQGRQEPIT